MIDTVLKHSNLFAAALLLWGTAVILGWAAVDRMQEAGTENAVVASARQLQPQPLRLAREPLPDAQYARIVEAMRPYVPAEIRIEALPTHITLSAERIELHPAMIGAFQELLLAAPDMQWTVDALCVGADCKPAAITATLKAYQIRRQRV